MPYPVKLHMYDVSNGLARTISVSLLGKYVDGLWHTAINVHGNEYFYGGNGIAYCPPCGTILGHPTEIMDLGQTEVTHDLFHEYLETLSQSEFAPEKYHVVDYNCNTFTNEVAQFLTGRKIPEKVTNLGSEIINTPFGQIIRPLIEGMQGPIKTGTIIGKKKHDPAVATGGNANKANGGENSKTAAVAAATESSANSSAYKESSAAEKLENNKIVDDSNLTKKSDTQGPKQEMDLD